jgi:hypothetical protein
MYIRNAAKRSVLASCSGRKQIVVRVSERERATTRALSTQTCRPGNEQQDRDIAQPQVAHSHPRLRTRIQSRSPSQEVYRPVLLPTDHMDTMAGPATPDQLPLGLFIQPACLQHRYIRHANSSHIFERPERLRAVLLGVAAATARMEEADAAVRLALEGTLLASRDDASSNAIGGETCGSVDETGKDDISSLLSSLSIASASSTSPSRSFLPPHAHLHIVPPPPSPTPGQVLLHHPALQIAHSAPPEAPFPYTGAGSRHPTAQSPYLRDLFKWASEAVESIKQTGSEIPQGKGLNQGDLYLGPGSVLAIEGAVSGHSVLRDEAHQTRCKRCVRLWTKSVCTRVRLETPRKQRLPFPRQRAPCSPRLNSSTI